MTVPLPPVFIAQIVARNIVPVAGILVFDWSAANVLVLYFTDTLLAMAVIFAGLMRHMLPPPVDEGWAARTNAEVGYVGAAFLITAMLAIPLGVSLIFMLDPGNVDWRAMLADPAFCGGLVMQAIAAFWSGADLYRALRTHTPEQLRMRRRFALVFLRWMVLLMTTYSGIFAFLGDYSALFFVAVYAATSMAIEIAPDRFLRAMPGGAQDADQKTPLAAGAGTSTSPLPAARSEIPASPPTTPRPVPPHVSGRHKHKRY